VTLRARLTAAFLAVVLGPVLLGAIFVGTTVAAVERDRVRDRLDLAAGAVRAEIATRCDRLSSTAAAAARLVADGRVPVASVGATVLLTGPDGAVRGDAPTPAETGWSYCGGPAAPAASAIAARAALRDTSGALTGYAVALVPVDEALVRALGRGSGAAVTVLGTGTTAGTGRFVRNLEPEPAQPLRLAVAIDPPTAGGLYGLLVAVVGTAGLLAVVAAWWLARSTTRPLTELAYAAERLAAGDLGARVPVRSTDEVGRLAATFNRMTAEMRAYIRALTASRDQLRGYLALLGDTLSGTHDLGRILHVTLHTARAATGAQSGVVLLYDPATRMFVAQCAVGPPAADLGGLRLKPGEGLLGAVAESGVPARGRITDDTPLVALEPRSGTYVAVPFTAPHRPVHDDEEEAARGVLALYDRVGPDEFDEADLATLTTFAGQAAVALDNVRLHAEAQRLSLTDPLTGLFNYRYLRESLRREVERANRFGRTLTVVTLDLDHFKDVNDTYGHGAGDLVLAELARRIRSITREVDFAFRRGGEEFVILLPEADATGGAALARRLGTEVARSPICDSDHAISVTVSIGVAVYPEHGATGSAVLEAADLALYAAKAAGRDTYRIAPVPGASHGAQPARGARDR
jgi:two-component system, cell cycle response regulator